jgi:hypothetical protein
MKPRKNAIAICGRGALGLITSTTTVPLEWKDPQGNSYVRDHWTGIHLTNKIKPIGSPWCSTSPTVIGYLDEMLSVIDLKDF